MSGSNKLSDWLDDGTNLAPKNTRGIDVTNGLKALYTGDIEQLTDGSFEDWSITGYTPDNFEVQGFGGTALTRSTDSHAGTYAALLTAYEDLGGGMYVSDVLISDATYDAGETIQVKLYGKRVTGTADVVILYEYRDGEDTYNYNFSGASAGTWTLSAGGPGPDVLETLTLTDSYTQVTSTQATAPVGASGAYAMIVAASTNSGDTAVIDDYEVLVNGVDAATNGDFEAWTATNGLTSWDIEIGQSTAVTEETSIVYNGASAIKTVTAAVGGKAWFSPSELITGAESTSVSISYWTRGLAANVGNVTSNLYILNNTKALADKVWNFNTTSWDAYTDFSSLTVNQQQSLAINDSETYTQDSATVAMEASGKMLPVFFTYSDSSGDTVYLDFASATISELGYGNIITPNASGDLTFAGKGEFSGGIYIASGTAAAPSIAFSGDPDTGIWNTTANTIGFVTFGAERVAIDASYGVRSNGYYAYTNGSPAMIGGRDSDAADSIGVKITNYTTLATPGSKITSFSPDNGVTEKAYIDYLGLGAFGKNTATNPLLEMAVSGNDTQFRLRAGNGDAGISVTSNGTVAGGTVVGLVKSNNWGLGFSSGKADGASSVAHIFDTASAYSTGGAKLLSIQNNAVEKAYVDKDGGLTVEVDKPVIPEKTFCIVPFDSGTAVATGDGTIGFAVPDSMNGLNITGVRASVYTKGVTGATDVQVRRSRGGADVDVLSTKVTLGDEWTVADGVVNTSNDDLASGDMIFVDVDAVHSGTAPNGLSVVITAI